MMDQKMNLNSWAAITVASIVALASLTNSFEDGVDKTKEQKWAVTVTVISLALGFFAFVLRLLKQEWFMGTHFENGTLLIVLIFWAAGLPNLMGWDNGLAATQFGYIKDANLFFSSWFAFIFIMIKLVDIPCPFMGDRVSKFKPQWIGFGTAALIAMANSARVWKEVECDSTDEKVCARTMLGFILGAISGLFALIFMVFQHELIEQMMSVLFLAAWAFGVAYLTFNEGPAMAVGIFFFSVWTTFFFSLYMGTSSFTSLFSRMMGWDDTDETTGDAEPTGDQPTTEAGKGAEETAKHDEEDPEKE